MRITVDVRTERELKPFCGRQPIRALRWHGRNLQSDFRKTIELDKEHRQGGDGEAYSMVKARHLQQYFLPSL